MAARTMSKVTLEDVLKAHKRISGKTHKTPVFTSSIVDKSVGRQVYFKAECLQKTGAFKARGALNAITVLKESKQPVAGVVTHSSGNHGQAVAWAAKLSGLPCTVVSPNNTERIKKDAICGYGAELVLCEPTHVSRLEVCNKVAQETGKVIISPYDNYDVIAGQGTIAVEFLEEVPDLDAILVPVGGGGLISGIATAAKAIKPDIRVYAAEPEGKMLGKCLEAGERLWPNPPGVIDTIADALRTQQIGHLPWPILQQLVEKQVFSATDEQIKEAMKFVFHTLKLVIEPAAGTVVSAVLSEAMRKLGPEISKVGVILCGGNVDVSNLPWN